MPKYKKRVPEYTAIQFTGSNIREVLEELGPEFSTIYDLDIKGATDFVLKGYGEEQVIPTGTWVVVDREARAWGSHSPEWFEREFEPVKRAGRPPKPKTEPRKPVKGVRRQ